MFTGIIQKKGKVVAVNKSVDAGSLTVDCGSLVEGAKFGDSIANNGTCLTIAGIEGSIVVFDVMKCTYDSTNLGDLQVGDYVNLEKALSFSGNLGGHMVTGHVDGCATIAKIDDGEEFYTITYSCSKKLTDEMVMKGSVAVDGVSMTIQDLQTGSFSISLIPVTKADTNLATKQIGQKVNVETDMIGKYVIKVVSNMLSQDDGEFNLNSLLQKNN